MMSGDLSMRPYSLKKLSFDHGHGHMWVRVLWVRFFICPGVGQSFLTSRFARNEIDFFSPLNSKVTQLVNCTWKLPEPVED